MSLDFSEPINTYRLCEDMLKLPHSPATAVTPYGELDRRAILSDLRENPPAHLQTTLHYIMATQFSARSYEIFRMRYCGHKCTLQEIGDIIGVTHERARQILASVHYRLCSPYCLVCMRDGIEQTNRRFGESMSHIASYRNGFDDGYKKGISKLGEDPTLPAEIMETPVFAMTKLSNRSRNALARANIFTLQDIVKNGEYIPKLNGIGISTVANIIETLEEYHIDCAPLRAAASKAYRTPMFAGGDAS